MYFYHELKIMQEKQGHHFYNLSFPHFSAIFVSNNRRLQEWIFYFYNKVRLNW